MASDIPTTHEEIEALTAKVPPESEIAALVQTVKVNHRDGSYVPIYRQPLLWGMVSLAIFLAVVLVAVISLVQQKNSAEAQVRLNNQLSECRAVLAANGAGTRAEAILAGNHYQEILGRMLVNAVLTPENRSVYPELAHQLDLADQELSDTAAKARQALDEQSHTPGICKK